MSWTRFRRSWGMLLPRGVTYFSWEHWRSCSTLVYFLLAWSTLLCSWGALVQVGLETKNFCASCTLEDFSGSIFLTAAAMSCRETSALWAAQCINTMLSGLNWGKQQRMRWTLLPSCPAGGRRCPAVTCSVPAGDALGNKWLSPVCPGHWPPCPDQPSAGGTAAPACLRSHAGWRAQLN